MFFFLAIDMDAIDVDLDPFPIDIIMLFRSLAFLFDDILEILECEFFLELLEYIEPEKRESALVQHEVMGIFGILSGFISYLQEIFMKHVLENLLLFTDFVDTKARVRLGKMFVSYIKQNR